MGTDGEIRPGLRILLITSTCSTLAYVMVAAACVNSTNQSRVGELAIQASYMIISTILSLHIMIHILELI